MRKKNTTVVCHSPDDALSFALTIGIVFCFLFIIVVTIPCISLIEFIDTRSISDGTSWIIPVLQALVQFVYYASPIMVSVIMFCVWHYARHKHNPKCIARVDQEQDLENVDELVA
jgi:hypothetical protein